MNVDKILGEYETRYFGKGHKKTRYYMDEITSDNFLFISNAKIDYQGLWSEKSGVQLTPHLSTIDAMILSILCTEKYFISKYEDLNIEKLFLTRFEIKAGSKPIENTEEIKVISDNVHICNDCFKFKYKINGMAVYLEFIDLSKFNIDLESNYVEKHDFETINYFSNHLKNVIHDIINIECNESEIQCNVIKYEIDKPRYFGLSSELSNYDSALEWIVIASQITQVLSYYYDKLERKNSNNLWMRHIQGEFYTPFSLSETEVVTGKIDKSKIASFDNKTWRTFELSGGIPNKVMFKGKVSHILPEDNVEKGVIHEQRV